VSADCRRVRAAPLVARGNGLHMNVRVGRPISLDLPERAAELKAQLDRHERPHGHDPFVTLMALRSILTEHVAIAAQESATENGSVLSEMLAIGVSEPGRVTVTDNGLRGHVDLIDPAQLADLSGVNVVSGFPARDLASGGNGGPLSPLPLWLLFRSAHRHRIFLHLGRIVRLVRLPRLTGSLSSVSGLGYQLSRGTALVDLLVNQLTNGRRKFDSGGRLAVQGRRVDELVEHWLSMDETLSPPTESDASEMLRSAVTMAVERGWTVYDLLCSATHFVAESAARSLRHLAQDPGGTEVVLAGGGLANGLILRHLTAHLSDYAMQRIEQLGGQSNVIPGAVAATLALLHFDQVPANVAGLTGAETPRVLGNLTPGSPQAWQRLLASCVSGGHSIRPLRAAL
jgi:anhydro-N-acetylmuramic acid kinase